MQVDSSGEAQRGGWVAADIWVTEEMSKEKDWKDIPKMLTSVIYGTLLVIRFSFSCVFTYIFSKFSTTSKWRFIYSWWCGSAVKK